MWGGMWDRAVALQVVRKECRNDGGQLLRLGHYALAEPANGGRSIGLAAGAGGMRRESGHGRGCRRESTFMALSPSSRALSGT